MRTIESNESYNTFIKQYAGQPSILVPIFGDASQHPAANRLCFMGVYLMNDKELVGLSFDHPEGYNFSYKLIEKFSDSPAIYTLYKKDLLFLLPDANDRIFDIRSAEYLEKSAQSHTLADDTIPHPQNADNIVSDVNKAFPLYKWMEYCEVRANREERVINETNVLSGGYTFMNEIAIPALQQIESNGLCVDATLLIKCFGSKIERFIKNDKVYSQYNLYTSTGRPSCRFGGINFAALHKEDGQRTSVTSRFGDGVMVLIDFESYHVRLIADQMQYQLPHTSAHEFFGRQYFKSKKLTPEQYEQSKQKTFRLLYSDEFSDIDFFEQVKRFREKLWVDIQRDGYITSPIYGRKIHLSHIWEPSSTKVFNYYIQFMETERNLLLIKHLNKIFTSYRSKIILYNYDSILIDYAISDGGGLLLKVAEALTGKSKFPVRIKYGKNFGEMGKLSI